MTDLTYYPSGVPVTPQAKQLGFPMPVYVSRTVWAAQCLWVGPSGRHNQNTDVRIYQLLTHVQTGLSKRLAVDEDFVVFFFKVWYWCSVDRNKTKKRRAQLGARLFVEPETQEPWLYIFNPTEDKGNELTAGTPIDTEQVAGRYDSGRDSAAGSNHELRGEDGDVQPEDAGHSTSAA